MPQADFSVGKKIRKKKSEFLRILAIGIMLRNQRTTEENVRVKWGVGGEELEERTLKTNVTFHDEIVEI